MKHLTLTRTDHLPTCTLGILLVDGHTFHTLERPWLDNASNISCIPTGTYLCKLDTFPKHGTVYHVTDVPNRTSILIHAGNTWKDTDGCILIGTTEGQLEGKAAVLNSKTALDEFMQVLSGVEAFWLTVQ